jgi:hypothetical protein
MGPPERHVYQTEIVDLQALVEAVMAEDGA